MTRVLVVEHQESCPPAAVGRWLEGEGVELAIVRPYLGDVVPEDLGECDGLVVLGGSMGADEDQRAPWLPAVRALITRAARERRPVLGICLGHQLAALALGGRTGRNPVGQTVGARTVTRCEEAATDPVAAALPHSAWVPQWNDDAVLALPDGSTALAVNDRGDLLMARFAPTVWGIQGHPEAGREQVERWAATDAGEGGLTGCSVEELPSVLGEVERREPEVESAWRPVVAAWAGLLRAG